MAQLVWSPASVVAETCNAAVIAKDASFTQCKSRPSFVATLTFDNRVLHFCGKHAHAPNVTILETV